MTAFFKKVGIGISVLFALFIVVAIAKWQLPERPEQPSFPPAKSGASASKRELITVNAPSDASGKLSAPVLVESGFFRYGTMDGPEGCLRVYTNGKFRGRACEDPKLELGKGDGTPLKIQFQGEGRERKAYVKKF